MNIVLGMVLVNKGSSSESGRIEPRKHVAVEAHSLGRDVSRSSRVRGSGVVQNVSQDSRMRGSGVENVSQSSRMRDFDVENVSQGPTEKGSGVVCETVPQGSNVKGSGVCQRFHIGEGPHVVVVPEQMGNVVNPFWSETQQREAVREAFGPGYDVSALGLQPGSNASNPQKFMWDKGEMLMLKWIQLSCSDCVV